MGLSRGQIECRALSVPGTSPTHCDRYLIGHLGKSMFVPESNTAFASQTRVFGGGQAHLLLVAHGFGATRPDLAAEAATEALVQQLLESVPWHQGGIREDRLENTLGKAILRCHELVQSDLGSGGGGAVFTAAYILWPQLYLLHMGDCRGYLFRGPRVRQLTTDHVRRVAGGASPDRDILTNALGSDIHTPTLDLVIHELHVGDKLLLCTSELGRIIDASALRRTIGEAHGAGEALESLSRATQAHAAEATGVVAYFKTSGKES